MQKKIYFLIGICLLMVACTAPEVTPTEPPAATATPAPISPTQTPQATITATATATTVPVNMHAQPVAWFAPLPPMPMSLGRPFLGSEDYMDLFVEDASWEEVAQHIDVFKFYGEWVAHNIGFPALEKAVLNLNQRGIAIGIETGPLDPGADCGQNIEGFATIKSSMEMLQAVKDAGGTVQVIALDEPFYYAHIYDGPRACQWSPEVIAAEVGEFIEAARTIFPEIIVGDIEPLTSNQGANELELWMETFEAVNGYPLAFLHLDVNWAHPTWVEEVGQLAAYGNTHQIPIGMIYFGNPFDPDDATFLAVAGERVKRLELANGVQPDHVIFQSWYDKPDLTLPDSDPYTWTGFINLYFNDKASLGFATEGSGANLALNRPVTVSNSTDGLGGEFVVDGDSGSVWNSGGIAPQWVEIALDGSQTVQEIRLTISQYPEGATVHEVWVKTADGAMTLVETFDQFTTDGELLVWQPESPLEGVTAVRVVTTASPSWVSWREIEVIAAGD